MTHPKGWINRQLARMDRDVQNWPDWMRHEIEIRAQEQKAAAKPVDESEAHIRRYWRP